MQTSKEILGEVLNLYHEQPYTTRLKFTGDKEKYKELSKLNIHKYIMFKDQHNVSLVYKLKRVKQPTIYTWADCTLSQLANEENYNEVCSELLYSIKRAILRGSI